MRYEEMHAEAMLLAIAGDLDGIKQLKQICPQWASTINDIWRWHNDIWQQWFPNEVEHETKKKATDL